ncbi:MAG: hypothetical protein ACOCQG_01695 [Candidatus Nanoarchaeia archaeon]
MLKKSQMKMLETIMVLMIFFILLVFGLVFYAKFSQTSADETRRESLVMHGMDATERFQYSPEVLCSRGSVGSDTNCFDLLKLEGFKEVADEKKGQYSKYYPNNLIEVNIIYPEEESFILFNNTDENARTKEPSFIPAVFFDPVEDERSFGYLRFEVWS